METFVIMLTKLLKNSQGKTKMCGIVGYLGNEEKKEILLDGLQELEYRGYDSAGIAVIEGDKLNQFKAIGKLRKS